MTRTGLLLLLLGAPAAAQFPSSPTTGIRFQSKWDAHRTQVRVRPAGDTSAVWTIRAARRYDSGVFEIIPDQWDSLFAKPPAALIIEARIPQSVREDRAFLGALVGGFIGAAAVVANAATCKDVHAEGPRCVMLFAFTPLGASIGAGLGDWIGRKIPVREWQRVSVVK